MPSTFLRQPPLRRAREQKALSSELNHGRLEKIYKTGNEFLIEAVIYHCNNKTTIKIRFNKVYLDRDQKALKL